MSASPPRFAAALTAFWIAGAANPTCAQEAATELASPAVRLEAIHACRIISPTFAPDAPPESLVEARFRGGGKLSFPVAAPCPERTIAFDI